MPRELIIGGQRIADDAPCYVIAELGHNHGGRLQTALEMVRVAHECGVDAVKLQKRDNATLYTSAMLAAAYDHEHSYGPTYGAHRQALELGLSDYVTLRAQARARGVLLFATPFDEASADFLAGLDMPAYKIHSGGLLDERLIRHVAAFGRPILLSTGGGTMEDIDRAVSWIGLCPHAILHCTASYPLKPDDANLRCILTLRQRYPETVIGYSSHSAGIALSLVAYALGARIIEHHVTLDRASKGTDQAFSLEPKGLATLVEDLAKVRVALGDGVKRCYPSEQAPIAKMRRTATAEGWRIAG